MRRANRGNSDGIIKFCELFIPTPAFVRPVDGNKQTY